MTEITQKRNYRSLARRLGDAGYQKDFVQRAILPEWWSQECVRDPAVLPEVEFSVARFLRTTLEAVRDPAQPLTAPPVAAKLRVPTGTSPTSYAHVMFAGVQIANAVARNLVGVPDYVPISDDPASFREEVKGREAVTLRSLLEGLWAHGIPVLRIPALPSPKFHGMACMASGRPVILLGRSEKSEPKVLNTLSHEAGHVARGHVTEDSVTCDVESSEVSDLDFEKDANKYAQVLRCGSAFPSLASTSPGIDGTTLARIAREAAKQHGVDAGLVVHFWSIRTGLYGPATRALEVLRKMEAHIIIDDFARRYVNVDGAPETDSRLLSCAFAD